jgi:hypothetical protein
MKARANDMALEKTIRLDVGQQTADAGQHIGGGRPAADDAPPNEVIESS